MIDPQEFGWWQWGQSELLRSLFNIWYTKLQGSPLVLYPSWHFLSFSDTFFFKCLLWLSAECLTHVVSLDLRTTSLLAILFFPAFVIFISFIHTFSEHSQNAHSRPGSILTTMYIVTEKWKTCIPVGEKDTKWEEKSWWWKRRRNQDNEIWAETSGKQWYQWAQAKVF